MMNRYGREHDHSRYPPLRDNVATIQLLTGGAESIIQNSYRYHQRQYSQHDRDESSQDGERNVRTSSFAGILPLLFNFFVFGVIAVSMFLVSLGEFYLFYTLAMPTLHSNNVLHFDYTGTGTLNHLLTNLPPDAFDASGRISERTSRNSTNDDRDNSAYYDGSCSIVTNTTQSSKTCSTPYIFPLHPLPNIEAHQTDRILLQSAPVAIVDLFSNKNSWQHYHPDVVPEPKQEIRILKKGKPHFIEIFLDLPESNTNREKVGIFSVVVDLHSTSFRTSKTKKCNDTANPTATMRTELLASSTRTARMPHESFWISVVRKVLCIIPHILGAIKESRTVIIPSYRFFVESEAFPLRYVMVRLLVSPEKARKGDVVEVVEGTLHIGEELTGMQLVLKEWFFTCMTIGTLAFFSLQLVLFLFIQICWNERCQRRQAQEQERIILEDNISEGFDVDGLQGVGSDAYFVDNRNIDANTRIESSEETYFEVRPPQSQQQNNDTSDYIDDEEAEWEDLPQQTTEMNSRLSIANEHSHIDRDEGEDSESTCSFSHTGQSEDKTHHIIPEN